MVLTVSVCVSTSQIVVSSVFCPHPSAVESGHDYPFGPSTDVPLFCKLRCWTSVLGLEVGDVGVWESGVGPGFVTSGPGETSDRKKSDPRSEDLVKGRGSVTQ